MLYFSSHQEKVSVIEDGRPPLRVRLYETHQVQGAWRIVQKPEGWYASRKTENGTVLVGPCQTEGLLNQELKRRE